MLRDGNAMSGMAMGKWVPAALLFLAAATCIPLVITAIRRRNVAGAMALGAMACGVFLWTTANGLQLLLSPNIAQWTTPLAFAGIGLLPLAWLSFALRLTGHRVPLLVLFLGVGIWGLTVAMVVTNGSHQLMWRLVTIDGQVASRRWWYFWFFTSYAYGAVLIGTFWILANFGRLSMVYRWQGLVMAGAGMIPLLTSVLYLSRILPRFSFDPTPLAFLGSLILMDWALFRLGMLDLVPVPPELLIEKISDGLIVVDRQERLVTLNSVAANLFQCNADKAIGLQAETLWPGWRRVRPLLESRKNTQDELTLENGPSPVHLEIKAIPLPNRRGIPMGHLLLLRDVTESRQRESERERLVSQLQSALGQVKRLSGLLPICASCKKIRDDQNQWHPLETYLKNHSEAEFSHGMCPQCYQKFDQELTATDPSQTIDSDSPHESSDPRGFSS